MENNTPTIMDQLKDVMLEGDEQRAKKFIFDHFSEFPEDFQRDIASSVLLESIHRTTKKEREACEQKTQATVNILETVQQSLEAQIKLASDTAANGSADPQ